MVVPVPLYAVEKLARLFFPLSPSVFFFFSLLFPRAMAESERRAVGFHRTLGQGRGCRRTRRDGRGRSGQRRVAFTSSFSVSEVSIDPSANEFCNPIKTFPSVVIKSLSKGYLDIARSGKTFRVPTIFLAIPRNRPLKTSFSNRGLPKKNLKQSLKWLDSVRHSRHQNTRKHGDTR